MEESTDYESTLDRAIQRYGEDSPEVMRLVDEWAMARVRDAKLRGADPGTPDDQLVNGPFCARHGRVGATIDGKCGQCYGVGRQLDDRIGELESQCEALVGALRFISGARYVVRTASGVFKATNVPFDDDELLLDLEAGPF